MADEIFEWIGNAEADGQVDSITVDAVAAQDYTLTVNNKTAVYSHPGGGTAEDVVDGLIAAWNAMPDGEFRDAEASKDATTPAVVLSSVSVGTPFTVVAGTNLTLSNKLAATGPNHWGVAENYRNLTTGATSGVPALNDEVHIRENRPSILYGLDTLSAVQLKQVIIDAPMQGTIGLPPVNNGNYSEYRPQYLQQPMASLIIGRGTGPGSLRIHIDFMAAAVNATIHQTGGQSDADRKPIQLHNADGASATLDIRNGGVDVNRASASKGGFSAINITNGECRVWPDFNKNPVQTSTLTVQDIGHLIVGADATLVGKGGRLTIADSASATSITLSGACSCTARLSGTIGNLTMDHPNANLDASQHPSSITVSAWTITRGQVNDPNGILAWGTGTLPKGRMVFTEN